jgi:hypothetical protein
MAKVTITYQFASGDALHVTVKADSNYPDALAELEARAVSTLKEAWMFLPDDVVEP